MFDMKLVRCLVLASATAPGCSAEDAQPSHDTAPAAYASTCAACHGKAGEGVPLLGPELRHAPVAYSSWVVRNGRATTTMLAYPTSTVTDAQLTEIQAWLGAFPKPTSGQELYVDFCGNCHGPTGMGGPLLPSYVSGKLRADIVNAVRVGAGGSDPSMRYSYMPAEDTTRLTDAELDSIATFLGAL